ncbi:MAG: formyltetrahydrofolate deformylase [Gammaproteobacteria bacterium]|nr:formyltetrahydrofolate deformylase [Gammaproteobacteria bacterium]MBT8151540.1 formyltetrahydrofolate deformylase [Gammaproteobacteria bacterium]NND39849.1 formyltetrahydrofolate deformylase [Pseudomonadales bacterium]NNM11145.1 formyltetrahydrofolate deformylase [Pseudomonadales bacterium]
MQNSYRLVIDCPDRVGIVARVSQYIAGQGGSLLEASYHADPLARRFFMRTEIAADTLAVSPDTFSSGFAKIADEFSMNWHLRDASKPRKVALLVSRASHCLADLLHRWRSGDLQCEVPCIISNHESMREIAGWYDVPFFHVAMPADAEKKRLGFAEIERLLVQHDIDTVVLARFMQIMPQALCARYPNRMINIHHSFLPSFIGANPYKRAFERGVKLIGATCHYVTEALDEGPIIEQDVIRVGHQHDDQDMLRLGKDVEARVLAQGLRLHLEDRAIVVGNKTVIFD